MQSISNATAPAQSPDPLDVNSTANAVQGLIQGYTGVSDGVANLLAAALVLALFLVLSEAARYFVNHVAPRLVSGTKSSLDDEVLKAVRGPIRLLIALIGLYLALKTLEATRPFAGALDTLATVVLVLVAAYLVSNLIKAVLRWYARDVAPRTGSDLDDHLIPFFEKLLTAVVYVLALLLIMSRFGVEITALVASLGVAGIAVALAAQETLSNLFGAFAILTDRPYKIGDRLLIPGVGQGDVVDIGLRSTRLRTRLNEVLVIPNQQMASSEIINLSLPDARLRVLVKVGIGYRSDVDRACATMEAIARADASVAREPAPAAYVSALGDFAIEITMLVWIADYTQDIEVPDRIYREILAKFREAGIEITYPVMTVLPKVV